MTTGGTVVIGVVIPARDEEKRLPRCLASLTPFADAGDPIVVVDDGSRDATASVASGPGVEVLASPSPGRGFAVAAGIDRARDRGAEVVLIVHADMEVDPRARDAIAAVVETGPRSTWGFLGHVIDAGDPRYRWIERGNRFRARTLRLPYGDQAQFFRWSALQDAGPIPRQERLEDLEIALRLRRAGPPLDLGVPVRIPPRHWERGVTVATLRNLAIVLAYLIHRRGAILS